MENEIIKVHIPTTDDPRNVVDEYKNISNDEINVLLKNKAFPYAVCMQHISGDFNLGTVLRNCNAFNATEMFYFGGKRSWDRRSALGTHHYTKLTHIKSIENLKQLKEKYVFIGVDNIPGSVDFTDFDYPDNCLLIFGEEGLGILPEIAELCSAIIYIPQYGSVRSLNVGTASGILVHDFVSKYRNKNKACG